MRLEQSVKNELLILALSGLILFGSGILVGMGIERGRGEPISFEKWTEDKLQPTPKSQKQFNNQTIKQSDNQTTGLININTASAKTLEVLPGIGPAYAQKIIDYRSQSPFTTIEEIIKVKGISPKTFEKIRGYITVD